MNNLFPFTMEFTVGAVGRIAFYRKLLFWFCVNGVALFIYAAAVCLAVKVVF